MRSDVRTEARDFIDWMKELDEVLGHCLPAGSSVTVENRVQAEVTEAFFVARRTYGSVFLLMSWSIWTKDTDRTEDAALLTRKLLEIYSRFVFVASGSADPIEQEVRASRVVLDDMRRHIKMLRAAYEISGREDHWETLQEWEQAEASLVAEVSDHTASEGMPPIHDILKGVSPMHALLWRELSDISHGGVMGRSYQRQDLTFGTPASPERQDRVMATALSVMGELVTIFYHLTDLDCVEWDDFSSRLQAFLAEDASKD